MKLSWIKLENLYRFNFTTTITGAALTFKFNWNARLQKHFVSVFDSNGVCYLDPTLVTINNPIPLNINARLNDRLVIIYFIKKTTTADKSFINFGDNYHMVLGYD